MIDLRVVSTAEMSDQDLGALRRMLTEAFDGDFGDEDWEHTIGGVHVFLASEEGIVAHASVIERVLVVGERPLRTGYVEAVATSPSERRKGYGSTVMHEVGRRIQADYELGALAADVPDFYSKLGWERWRGKTYALTPDGPRRTPDEDDAVMVLRTEVTRSLDPTERLMCDPRAGDVW